MSADTGQRPKGSIGLRYCPSCDYDLRGAAESGRCPECGFGFDPAMIVMRPMRRSLAANAVMTIIMLGIVIIFIRIWLDTGVQSPCCLWIVFPALGVLWFGGRAVHEWMVRRGRHELGSVILSDDGVRIVLPKQIQHSPWSDVGSYRLRKELRLAWPRSDPPLFRWRLRLIVRRPRDQQQHRPSDVLFGAIEPVTFHTRDFIATEQEKDRIESVLRAHDVPQDR